MVATYRDSDGTPKEHFYYHAAGLAGHGGSSYIDSVIWRDKDANTAWNSAADSTMEQRRYFCQNWRADVSAVLSDDGSEQIESIKYFSYGYPVNIPAGDYDLDGDVDVSDENQAKAWEGGSYRARADVNLDGSVTSADTTIVTANIGLSGGRGVLSRSDTGNRKGYAGYESDATADAGGSRFWHVRHRVLDSTLGRWTRRDPLGYVDGMSLSTYASAPLRSSDSLGLVPHACGDPWPNSLPPCKSGSQGRQRSVCDEACTAICDRNPQANGVTLCIGKQAVTCLCTRNIRDSYAGGGNFGCFEKQMMECTLKHENQHAGDIDCSCNPDGEITDDLPWKDAECGGPCSECEAYGVTLSCLTQVDCVGKCSTWREQELCFAKLRDAIDDAQYFQHVWCTKCRECKALHKPASDTLPN